MQFYISFQQLIDQDPTRFDKAVLARLYTKEDPYLNDKYVKTEEINLCVGDLFSLTETICDRAEETVFGIYGDIYQTLMNGFTVSKSIRNIGKEQGISPEYLSTISDMLWIDMYRQVFVNTDYQLKLYQEIREGQKEEESE